MSAEHYAVESNEQSLEQPSPEWRAFVSERRVNRSEDELRGCTCSDCRPLTGSEIVRETTDSPNDELKDARQPARNSRSVSLGGYFNAEDANAEHKEKFERLCKIDNDKKNVYKQRYWRFRQANYILEETSNTDEREKRTEEHCRTLAVADEILNHEQAQHAAELIDGFDLTKDGFRTYSVEFIAIVLCRLIADRDLPTLTDSGYSIHEIGELQRENQQRMNERQRLVCKNSERKLHKKDVNTIKAEIKNQTQERHDSVSQPFK